METSKNILKNSCLFRIVMRIMVLVALLGHSSVANSQYGVTYPVDINAMLTPPYGTCLTDYVGTNRFQCNVLMRDMHATGYKFRILMTVKDMASGRVMFSAQSDQHTVTPGKPVYMAETGVFSEFFKAGNILSSTAYRDGCLNEGAYNFVFQVVDDNDKRRIPISKECVFPARLQAGGAPLLISPFTGTNIDCNQTIVNFSWQMPIVTGEQTKYLIEICPTDEGGNGLHYLGSHTPSANGVKPSQGYMSATSYMPMFVLEESSALVPNTTYFWRVSIIDELGNVKPNSTSEIDSFTYCYTKELEPYTPLKEPKVKAINGDLDTVHIDTVKTEDNATKATWFLDDVRFKYQSYALDIRKKSQDTWTTYHIKINEGDTEEKNYYGLSNLKYNEPYEARMQYLLITDGDTSYAPFSDTITFVVPNPMDTADCGEIMAIKDCNGEKGKILKKYDTLYANGTPVVLDSIVYKAGDSTVISGYGVISFPILKNFKLKMSFNEVSVNCYGELVSGQVVSVYKESTGAIIDLNHWTGKGDGGGSQSTNERPDPTNYKDKDEAKEKMQTGDYAQIGDSLYTKDKDGNVVALGKTLSIPAEKYINNNTLDDDDVYCIFRNDTKDAPFIGFDADEHKYYRGRPTLGDHYTPTFSKQDGADFEYIIPYVASNPGRVVKLSATLEGRLTDEYNKDSVKFIMPLSGGNYLALNAKKEGDKFIVDFPGGKNPDTNSDVYAIVKKGEKYVNVGKINIETYAWRTQKVKFVPVVNDYGVDEKAISETLNRIYGRFGITYEVTKDEKFEMIDIDKGFVDNFSIGSGLLSNQSSDMKRLQGYYKKNRDFNDSTAYIFLLKTAKEDAKIDGDMPQGQICGYIFMHSDNGTLSDGRLVAHEIAHGIYKLDHVFEKAYKIPQNSTNNLLDYNNGDQLAHFQWELIKHPGFAWAIFDKDEDSMGESTSIFNWLKDNNSLKTDDFEAKIEDNMSLYDYVNENSHSEKRYYLINGTISLEGDYNYLSAQNSFSQKNENDEVVHKDNMEILSDIHNEEEVTLSEFKKNNVYCIRTTPKFDDSDEVGKKLSGYFAMMHIYSFVDNPVLSNYKISKLSDLKNNKRVRAGYRTSGERYGLIAFYDESGNLQVVLQLYSPSLGVDKISIETWVEYLLISGEKTSGTNTNTSDKDEKKEATQPKDHFMVKDPLALVRKDASPHDAEDGKTQGRPKGMTIPKGTEVTIIDKDDANKVKQVQYVDDENKKYWTGEGNLEEIKVLDKQEDIEMSIGVFVKLPFTGDTTETQLTEEMNDLKKIAVCGDYFRVTSSKLPEFGSDKDSKGYWTFDWEAKAHLTAKEIAVIRRQIAAIEDKSKRESAFLKLQKKVEYHNQRDNDPSYVNRSFTETVSASTRNKEADAMCGLTSMAMALEMLGISKEDVISKLEDDGFDVTGESDKDFEDILDIVRVKKQFTYISNNETKYYNDRTSYNLWSKLADYLDVDMTTKSVKSSKKDGTNISNMITDVEKQLKEGKGVILSIYNNYGHIVRIQSISNTEIEIDDPFGKPKNMAIRDLYAKKTSSSGSFNANTREQTSRTGEDVKLTWDEINVSKDDSGCGGKFEVNGDQIYSTTNKIDENKKPLPESEWVDHYVKEKIEALPGKDEYVVTTVLENKEDRKGNVVKDKNGKVVKENHTHYTSYGGMIKYYFVFKKR